VKNYPNQASTFERIRGTLALIKELREQGQDASSSKVIGYAAARRGLYTFRGLTFAAASPSDLEERIAEEQEKAGSDQGPITFGRELRRTLQDMGWLDGAANVPDEGLAVLASQPGSLGEQALLVGGLLNIATPDRANQHFHHPVQVMLKLLAIRPSLHRDGLELALEPVDDSDAEFERAARFYELPREERRIALGITRNQRDNAVKIFPSLAVTCGLVVEDDQGYFSLSLEGWSVIGQTSATARQAIQKRRGPRTTVGKLVTCATVAERLNKNPPRTLTAEEQRRAAARRDERTAAHQKLVKRVTALIGDGYGEMFEDEFSYDLLWVPQDQQLPVYLFEMKTITNDTDAYARVRDAIGQLSYYDYFHVSPRTQGRPTVRVAAFDAPVPADLAEYLQHDGIGGVVVPAVGAAQGINQLGQQMLAVLPQTPPAA
jgi:hypothetical protein